MRHRTRSTTLRTTWRYVACGAFVAGVWLWPQPSPGSATRADEASLAMAAATPRRLYANPVIDRDFPDPDILDAGGTYYAFGTNAAGLNVQVARSLDLVSWTGAGDALPVLPAWARAGRTWAPDVSETMNGFVLYFTARHAASGRQCIGVATSASPGGPFLAASAPLVCQLELGGLIDPAAFV